MTNENRRVFLKKCSLMTGTLTVSGMVPSLTGAENTEIGKPLTPWKEGEMDLHFIYTGVGENMFYIFPDGTSMVLDTADRPSNQEDQFPIKPNKTRLPSEWVARYIERVNPAGKQIDYMMLSHYHEDHSGSHRLGKGRTTGRGKDYVLSGLANLGEIFHFTKVYDRGYPNYDKTPAVALGDGYENFRKFTDWKTKNGDFIMEEFKVGALDQITLTKKKTAYPTFHLRNICANGLLWTGKGNETENYYELYQKKGMSENTMSLAIVISYGPFRYFTGGDLSGPIMENDGRKINLEGAAGKTVGIVDVCKTNHHSYRDAMKAEFTREVQANVYVTNVWDHGHLQDNTMTNMTDPKIYEGPRLVCPTWVSKKQMELYQDKWWQKYLKPGYGHVVVRVFDGGKQYKVYHLTAEDESMNVKAVYGPFPAKG